MLKTLNHLGHLQARRGLTLLVLVAFCATLLPLPLIPLAHTKHDGEAFPCQDSPCGCRTAHQCWTNCCCTTPAQRVAWAKKHGVTPPAYAKLGLQLVAAPLPQPTAVAATSKSGCAKTGCTKTVTRSCCQTKTDKQPAAAPKREQRRFVIGALVLGCQGKSSAFTSLPWAVVPKPVGLRTYFLPLECQWLEEDLRPIFVAYMPSLPPPRDFSAI